MEPSTHPVEAVVVTHDAGALLDGCIESLAPQVGASRITLVDNASTDGSVERVGSTWAELRVIPAENRGFAAGNNVGLTATEAPFVLLLNPDAELGIGVVARLVEYLQDHPKVAIAGPRVANADGTTQYGSFGHDPSLSEAIRLAGWRFVQKLRGNRALSPRLDDAPVDVDWTTGAAMLVRREAVEQVGVMDERFFLYYEDLDWCRRMRDAGWRVAVVPDVTVIHHLGQSGGGAGHDAYRDSFEAYAGKYGLGGLRAFGRLATGVRSLLGGRG